MKRGVSEPDRMNNKGQIQRELNEDWIKDEENQR